MAAFKRIADVAKLGLNKAGQGLNMAEEGLHRVEQGTYRAAKTTAKVAKEKGLVAKQATNAAALKGTKKIVTSSLKDVRDKEGNIKKTMGNLWTGKKVNPLHVGVIGGGYLAAQAMDKNINFKTRASIDMGLANDYQNYGAPDVMSYDGVSQQRAPQNLNANGSLVFGLHNNRKG